MLPALLVLWLGGPTFRSRVAFYVLRFCNSTHRLNHFYRTCADVVTENGGDILEIGFGAGTAAAYIQQRGVNTHTIVEIDDYIFGQLSEWARDKPTVIAVKGDWYTNIPTNRTYDGILYDPWYGSISQQRKSDFNTLIEPHTKKGTILVCGTDTIIDKTQYLDSEHQYDEIVVAPPSTKRRFARHIGEYVFDVGRDGNHAFSKITIR